MLPGSLPAKVETEIKSRLSHRMGAIIFQHFEAFNYSEISNANTCSIHVFIERIPGIFRDSLSHFSTVWATLLLQFFSSLSRQVDCLLSSFDSSWKYSKCYATHFPLNIKHYHDKKREWGNVAPFLRVQLRAVYGLLINRELGSLIRANIGSH